MRLGLLAIFCLFVMSLACDRSSQPPTSFAPKSNANAAKQPEAPHDADGLDHEGDQDGVSKSGPQTGHGVEIIELGTTTIGELTIRAARDKGEIKAGGDAPIDVWVTTADGKPAKVAAVRFWIGTQDAKGSIKAKADIEIPAEPNHWHTHAEVPAQLPTGGKLWVEIEEKIGKKLVVSFDLKA